MGNRRVLGRGVWRFSVRPVTNKWLYDIVSSYTTGDMRRSSGIDDLGGTLVDKRCDL